MLKLHSSEPAALTSSHHTLFTMLGFKFRMHTTIALILLSLVLLEVSTERVLVLCPMSSRSHQNVLEGIYTGLAEKGHEVTLVVSGKPSKPPQKNIKEILVLESFELFNNVSPLEVRKAGFLGLMTFDFSHFERYCDQFWENPQVRKLLTEKFDVILYDLINNQCAYGLIHRLQTPYIAVSTPIAPSAFTSPFGNRLPPSFVPDNIWPSLYTDEMSFLQRTWNVISSTLGSAGLNLMISQFEKFYRKHLRDDSIPGVEEISANASLLFINSHLSFDTPKPMLPDNIEIGGAHIRPGKPLPPDLDEFVSGAKDGLILFSLGSIVRAHELPEEIRKVFVNAFAKLKQRVLWKWPLPMNDLPPNVKLSSWVPQQDVLAHPNTKLFISHGGLLSTQEAIYNGVPMIYFPIFGDQEINAYWGEVRGMGKKLEILDVTSDQLADTVNLILNDKRYSEKMSELSAMFHDQPQTPKERAVFWTEYVMRHKGALHLRSAARKLNFFQYYSIDSIAFIGAVLVLILWILKIVFMKTLRALCCSSKVPANKKKN